MMRGLVACAEDALRDEALAIGADAIVLTQSFHSLAVSETSGHIVVMLLLQVAGA